MIRKVLLLQVSVGALAWGGCASAQVAVPGPPADTTTTTANAQAAPASSGDIVVTGSRVISNGNNSPTPVTVISPQAVQQVQPGNLADTLQILPVFSGSRGSGSNPSATGSVGAGNGSANQLNLRNLGTVETLVLMDGKRVPPTLISGIVDVDSIPEMMVARVDVVTGGASAVYGSDAVAGVVNYILDKKLKGFRIQAENGISQRGDAGKYRAGIAWGTDLFGGRGHFEASYQYQKEEGIGRRSDRGYLRQGGVTGAGTAANPYVNQVDLRQSNYTSGGLITVTNASLAALGYPVGTRLLFNSDGTLRPFVAGATTGTAGVQVGGDGAYYDSSLLAPLQFNQFFGRFDYDFTDSIHGYVQAGGNIKNNTSYADNVLFTNYTINSSNPYLRPGYRALLAGAGQTTFTMSELMTAGPRLGTVADTYQVNLSAGLNGTLGAFKWTADYVHGQAILHSRQINNTNTQHLLEALDAVTDASGQIVCRVATITTSSCAPLNAFGAGAPSAAAIAYIQQDTHYRAKTVLDDATASIAGAPFDTWAGPVNVALSGEWRKLGFTSESDATPTDYVNCTNLRYNCTAANPPLLWLNTFPASPYISNTVWEGAVEANVPLVRDVSFIRSLDVSGAARYTSYQTSGNYWTWKAGLDWHITDTLRVRSTRSRDIRAPNLNDLFAPTYVSFVNPTDLLTGTSNRVPGINRSNTALKAEIGNTFTAGVVWRPISQFNVAVDYYHIKVDNAITQIQGQTAAIQQLCYASNGTSPYCALQIRPNGFADTSAANAATAWVSQSINLSSVETMGWDVEANFQSRLFDRPFAVRFLGAYQPHIYYRQPGVATVDQGGAAFGATGLAASPTVRLTGIVHVEPVDAISLDLLERWRNPLKLSGVPGEVWVNNRLPAFATTNVTLTFRPANSYGAEFYLNVQNLFDADPPTGGYTGNGTRAGYRDGYAVGDSPLGRYFTGGVKVKF